MNTFTSVDEYLQQTQPEQRAILEHIRSLIKQAVPDAVESVSYGMAGYKYKGKALIYFGAFTHHMSVFATPEPTEAIKDKLAGFTTSKGTVQFTVGKPLPDELIKDLLSLRVAIISRG